MKYLRLLVLAVLTVQSGYAQRAYIGIFGGVSSYTGDLSSKVYEKNNRGPAAGLSFNYDLTKHITIRTGYTYGKIGAADRNSSDPSLINRNLSFETSIHEFSVSVQYNLFGIESQILNPYVYAGFAAFKYNPYAFDEQDQKVFLPPLSTEGQGLSAYPERKPYKLIQCAIPFGGGIKVNVSPGLDIGLEIGMRKSFTQYLDDVSSSYVDWEILYNAKGQKALDMSFRGDELNHIPTNSLIAYPGAGTQRGDPNKDYYYLSGIHVTYKMGPSRGSGRMGHYTSKKGKMGCPVNVY